MTTKQTSHCVGKKYRCKLAYKTVCYWCKCNLCPIHSLHAKYAANSKYVANSKNLSFTLIDEHIICLDCYIGDL